jgi:hypothetical protein
MAPIRVLASYEFNTIPGNLDLLCPCINCVCGNTRVSTLPEVLDGKSPCRNNIPADADRTIREEESLTRSHAVQRIFMGNSRNDSN